MPNWAHMNLLHRGVRASLGDAAPPAVTGDNLSDYAFNQTNLDIPGVVNGARGWWMSDDGTRAFVGATGVNMIYGMTLSVANDITTLAADSEILEIYPNPFGLHLSNDGVYFYQTSPNGIYWGIMSTPWDVSTLVTQTQVTDFALGNVFVGIVFNPDGTKMYISLTSQQQIREYTLSTPFDPSTWSDSYSLDVSANLASSGAQLSFDAAGTKLYCAKNWDNTNKQYDLSTPWDLSTATYTESAVFTESVSPSGIFVSNDGKNLYMIQSNTDSVHQYVAP